MIYFVLFFLASGLASHGATKVEHFDREPASWEGRNNRTQEFPRRPVVQKFGFSAGTRHAGGELGEIGGTINPAGEPAYYGWPLPKPVTLADPLSASGRIFVRRGPGHFTLGFFNAKTAREWRTQNTMVARINGRGDAFHCHFEYCTSGWRAEAGVIGEIVRGERIQAREIPGDRVYDWRLTYDPSQGLATFTLNGQSAICTIVPEHRQDGATFTHFGLLPVLKAWDDRGEVWLDDLVINGTKFDFSNNPNWEGHNNQKTYETENVRPRFNFGWSATHFARGQGAGEMGGLVFRGDCREPARLAGYGDRIELLTLDKPLVARGKVAVLRAVSDSTAAIGFYHAEHSLKVSSAQDQSIPMDYLGINIEGPSSEGFYFYPVYRPHGSGGKAKDVGPGKAPRIFPDGKVHDWELRYDPEAGNGNGRITVSLDGQTCTLELEPGARRNGASFNRFGLCTPWIDGNSVTVFFDDLEYTCAQ